MSFFDYRDGAAKCGTIVELRNFYMTVIESAKAAGEVPQLTEACESRRAEIEAAMPSIPKTSAEALERIDIEGMEAVESYGALMVDAANKDARYRATRAKAFLKARVQIEQEGRKATIGEAEMIADADETVVTARQEAHIADALARSGRERLNQIERSFQYHRSLMVRENQADNR